MGNVLMAEIFQNNVESVKTRINKTQLDTRSDNNLHESLFLIIRKESSSAKEVTGMTRTFQPHLQKLHHKFLISNGDCKTF